MARVGIGVPVYNGGPMLADSLECLRTQSFEDFEVVIGDNASDDETADICSDFTNRDSRFRHLRRPENLGSLGNFQDLRAQSSAELFCWRAYDDLSATDFLEHLVGLFDARPDTKLAVCEVHSETDDGGRVRMTRYLPPKSNSRIGRIRHELFKSHASWIYGLWHRETLVDLQDRVHREYPHAWGWDHLTLLPVILDGQVAGTNQTHFTQRILRRGTTKAERKAKLPGLAALKALRADFAKTSTDIVEERDWTSSEKMALRLLLPAYIDRRGYSRMKLVRRAMRLRLGIGEEKP
ncbi:MAG: glycosyltransferase family 2 protein [Pseudomonadota bacterium]